MNIRPLLSSGGYDVVLETGMIDYKIVELGKYLQAEKGQLTEIAITGWDDERVSLYSFFDTGFSIQRRRKDEDSEERNTN